MNFHNDGYHIRISHDDGSFDWPLMGNYFSTAYDKAQAYIDACPELGQLALYKGGRVVATLTPNDDDDE